MNISPISVATQNQFENTINRTSKINNMDTFLKNLQLYNLLKNELDVNNNNNEFKKLLNDFEIKLFIENHNFFDDNQYNIDILNKLRQLIKLEKQNIIITKYKEDFNKNISRKQKAILAKIENACFNDDKCFEGVKESIAKGEELWSTYSNNPNFVNAFKKYLNNQYDINFVFKDDNNYVRYELGKLPDNYIGGKYKHSKKRLNRKKLTKRNKKRHQHASISRQQGGLHQHAG